MSLLSITCIVVLRKTTYNSFNVNSYHRPESQIFSEVFFFQVKTSQGWREWYTYNDTPTMRTLGQSVSMSTQWIVVNCRQFNTKIRWAVFYDMLSYWLIVGQGAFTEKVNKGLHRNMCWALCGTSISTHASVVEFRQNKQYMVHIQTNTFFLK